jgi:hypothetical protein
MTGFLLNDFFVTQRLRDPRQVRIWKKHLRRVGIVASGGAVFHTIVTTVTAVWPGRRFIVPLRDWQPQSTRI